MRMKSFRMCASVMSMRRGARGAQLKCSEMRDSAGEQALELFAARAAELYARPVSENQGAIPPKQRVDLPHAIDVHDRRPMHADEARRIEPLLQRGHRLAQQVRLPAGVQRDVVI